MQHVAGAGKRGVNTAIDDRDGSRFLDTLSREELLLEVGTVSAEIEKLRDEIQAKEKWLSECRQRLAC